MLTRVKQCRNNLSSAERLITQLLSPEPSDPDVAFEVHLLRIDLLMRYGSRSDALSELEKVAAALHDQSADVYQRIRLWTLKAILLADCERPLMGLSVALRAAKSAQRAKLIPAFCHAMAVVSNLLTNLKEFDAATQLLGSIMSRVSLSTCFFSSTPSFCSPNFCTNRLLKPKIQP